jgi:hypothetical protein
VVLFTAYRVTDLMSGILDGRKLQIDFALFSGAKADPEQQLFVSDPRVASGQVAIRQASLQLFGQNWTFSFYAQPGFFKRFHQGQDLLPSSGRHHQCAAVFLTRTLPRASRTHSNLLAT